MAPGSLTPFLPLVHEFWGWSCSALKHLTSDLSPQGSLQSSGLFQSMHSEVLPRRAEFSQSSFTNPHDSLLCRVILCRALSSGSKTLSEDRSPETGLELVLGCQAPVRTIFCMEKLPPRGRLSLCAAAFPKGDGDWFTTSVS